MNKIKSFLVAALLLCSAAKPLKSQGIMNEPTWETMKYGLFVHFVFGGEYGGMTPLSNAGEFPQNIDEFVEKFNAQKFADDVKAMGFEYVIFTAWHANMGVLYPSQVMADYQFDQRDHFTARRDLPGEIMDALAVRGIQFCVYTHIWVGHDFHPGGTRYYSYENVTGPRTQDMINTGYPESVEGNSTQWNDFVCAVYDEMSARYGEKISAYWFDGTWTNKVDKKRIMETIRKTNKTCAFVANGTPDHGLPFSSKEVGSPAGIEYGFHQDYPPVYNNDVTTWPAYERNIAIIQGGNWWASASGKSRFNAEAMYRFTVLEAGTNTGGGVSWAFSPFVDGNWEGDLLNVAVKAYAYLAPVEEAVKNTHPSASFITKEGAKISTLESGFVATRSANGQYEYIHVLNRRTENFIILPNSADGRAYESAIVLPSKKPVALERYENGYLLTLPKGEKWDSLNTVIRLQPGVGSANAILKPIHVPAGSSPALVSGKIVNNGMAIELVFDKSIKNISQQQEFFQVRINGELVVVSLVSSRFTSVIIVLANPVRMGDKVSVAFDGGAITATDGGVLTKFSKVPVKNPIKVIFAKIPGKIEAESFNLNNGAQTEASADIGGGENLGYLDPGDWMDYAIDAPKDGQYTIKVRVSGVTTGSIVLQTPGRVKSTDLGKMTLSETGGWQTWTTDSTKIFLPAGKQYLRILVEKSGFNVNYFELNF